MTNEERKQAQEMRDRIGGYEIKAALVYEYLETAIDNLDTVIVGSGPSAIIYPQINTRKAFMNALKDIHELCTRIKKEEYGD